MAGRTVRVEWCLEHNVGLVVAKVLGFCNLSVVDAQERIESYERSDTVPR